MGTDIHMFAEVRRQGRWSLAEPLEGIRDYWPDEVAADQEPPLRPRSLYFARNYALFAILANVCNPMRAVTPFEYISEPRGLPPDLSPPLLDCHACWDVVFESWLTLEELIAFDWHGKQIVRRGMVDPAVAHLFPPGRRGFPISEWPMGLTISVANQSNYGVEVRWIETYAEAVGDDFMSKTLGTLRGYGQPQDVRVVFWFDQ